MEKLQNDCIRIRKYLRARSLTNTWLVRELRKYGVYIGPSRLCDVLRLKSGGTDSERFVIEAAKKVLAAYQKYYVQSMETNENGS